MLVGFRWSKNDVISIAFVIYEWCPMCITRCIGCVVNIVHKGISVNNHSDSVSHVANQRSQALTYNSYLALPSQRESASCEERKFQSLMLMSFRLETVETYRRVLLAVRSKSSTIPPLRLFVVADELEVDVKGLEHHVHRERLHQR